MKPNTSSTMFGTLSAITAAMIGYAVIAHATPQMEPEGEIETSEFIQMEIYHDEMMGGAEVAVTIDGGIATLTGHAKCLAQVERAAAKVFANPEVLTVVNLLRITPVDSSTITSAARTLMAEQNLLDANRIKISAEGSRIILEGEVNVADEGELARELVSEIGGATSVENRLVIDFQGVRTDGQIASQLAYSVNDDPVFSGLGLEPQVSEGVVKWSGEVGSRQEFERLVRKSFVTGVIDVEMKGLSVNGDLAMEAVEDKNYSPSQSLEALQVAIKHDPRLSAENISPSMEEGVITLLGNVSDPSTGDAAELTARCIPGVLRVSNQLSTGSDNRFASNNENLISASAPLLTR